MLSFLVGVLFGFVIAYVFFNRYVQAAFYFMWKSQFPDKT